MLKGAGKDAEKRLRALPFGRDVTLKSFRENGMDFVSRPKRTDVYRLEAVDGELLLCRVDGGEKLPCTPEISLIWQLCDGLHTTGEIAVLVEQAYPEDRERVVREVREALEQLCARGLVRAS